MVLETADVCATGERTWELEHGPGNSLNYLHSGSWMLETFCDAFLPQNRNRQVPIRCLMLLQTTRFWRRCVQKSAWKRTRLGRLFHVQSYGIIPRGGSGSLTGISKSKTRRSLHALGAHGWFLKSAWEVRYQCCPSKHVVPASARYCLGCV